MAFARRLIAFAVLLQSSVSVVEFTRSRLYDETDFAQATVELNFCDVGCRIYVSLPESSAEVARQIMVHDYDKNDKSLYDVSKLKKFDQKGYLDVEAVGANIMNMNPGFATAPIAVWVVRKDGDGIGAAAVYEAAALHTDPADISIVTVMSAVPFHIRTSNDGPMPAVATLTGFDAITEAADGCTYVIYQMNADTSFEIQANVQSPLITIFFDDVDQNFTKSVVTADVGKGKLDLSGISFAASPGFIGCNGNGQKTYRSSLYDASTSFSFSNYDRWSSTTQAADKDITLQQTNSLDISWTRNDANLDQSFLIRLTPWNEQANPDATTAGTTEGEPERTTEAEAEGTTTDGGEDPNKTTVKPRRTTSEKPTSTTTHPKDVSTTTHKPTTTSTLPTTTSTAEAGYGSTLTALTLVAVFLL